MPLLLDGANVILCAPTASGKTEAALAPLIERHLPPERTEQTLAILYLLPTRALINDLARRLAAPLERLRVRMAVKTRDLNTLRSGASADLLLTTPESLDALLAADAKALAAVRAVVIDELHIFDGGVRGDQLRVVLARLRQVRAYAARRGDAPDDMVQYVALSATLAQPAAAADRYFAAAQVVAALGGRRLQVELLPMSEDSAEALIAYLATFQRRGWRKALIFCNTRAEVEAYATAIRAARTPFGHAVYVHYSNLDRIRRQEIEQQFAQAGAAVCCASSTLELGIDVGSVDAAIQIGAPGSAAAFVQRIGRAGRRRQTAQAACFYRTPLEEALLATLAAAPVAAPDAAPAAAPFRPSVAVQQVFSLLLQSPTGALRLPPLADLFDGLLSVADLGAILGYLQERSYLLSARSGEWRAGPRLRQLVDLQASEHAPLSLHSNIENRAATLKLRDQQSQQVVATVDALWLDREVLTLEGRPLDVRWFDGDALWVTARREATAVQRLPYLSARQLLSLALAQSLAEQAGFAPGAAPTVEMRQGWLLFHWLGDVYGQALLDLLRPLLSVEESPQPGLCLLLHDQARDLPPIKRSQVERYLGNHVQQYERLLALGSYQHLLPLSLRRRAVLEQFDLARFETVVAALRPVRVAEATEVTLLGLAGLPQTGPD